MKTLTDRGIRALKPPPHRSYPGQVDATTQIWTCIQRIYRRHTIPRHFR